MSAQLKDAKTASSATDIARFCKAAGDALRAEILCALATDSYGVLELSHAFEVQQSGMSHHLKVLAGAGLVTSRREGNSIFYRRTPLTAEDPLRDLKLSLYASLVTDMLSPAVRKRLAQVHAERARRSQEFFIENAHKFREQQDLIASFPVYEQQVAEILKHTVLPRKDNALEVGPGEGELLPFLATHFEAVLGLDNSAAMLSKAQNHCTGIDNVRLLHGDTGLLTDYPARFDCAVMNMVLHHTPSPRQLFTDIGAALRPGGVLLVTELCRHDQTWVTEACGDIWLGFEPVDLTVWAEEAEMADGESSFMALRNGFQVQIRQFFKRGSAAERHLAPQPVA